MRSHLAAIVAIGLGSAAGSAIVAAPQTPRPGDMTRPSVWVENRTSNEAIPVSVDSMNPTAEPLRVEIFGTPTVTLPPAAVVQTRAVRQPWEHRLLSIPAGQDVAAQLAKPSSESWEAVGFQINAQGATLILLKRPM
jgi:hypothetical protein